MTNIYVNLETGNKIKVYKQTMVHVFDHADPRDILDFRDTAEGVAQWCMENLDKDHENYDAIHNAYENQEWEEVIELEGCRHCNFDFDEEWFVEEIKENE
jgi:hypothetical protein